MRNFRNEKGFTIVELITSFALATVVLVFLFNIVLLLKDHYNESKRTNAVNVDLATFSNTVNRDFIIDNFSSIGACTVTDGICYEFRFVDTSRHPMALSVQEKRLEYYNRGNTMEKYVYNLEDTNYYIDMTKVEICKKENVSFIYSADLAGWQMNSYLYIYVPIKSNIDGETYSFKIVYPYNYMHPTVPWSMPTCTL